MEISDIKVVFNSVYAGSATDLTKILRHCKSTEDIKFGYCHFESPYGDTYILPRPGAGLLSYTSEALMLPGFEGKYILNFKGVFKNSCNRVAEDLEYVMKNWQDAISITGFPSLFSSIKSEVSTSFQQIPKRIEIYRY